jgi:hypothetical protein
MRTASWPFPILVDGAALDATSFGELDDNGYWNPIAFTETARTGDLTPTWRSVYTDTEPTTTSTSGSITTGADSDDWVVVTVEASGGSANAPTACTLGGQAMTLVATTDNANAAGGVAMFKIASSAISNAATAVVVATWSSAPNRNSINVLSVSGPLGSVYDSYASSDDATISSFSDTMQIPAGGCVIASSINNGSAYTWVGLTEDSDEYVEFYYTSAASAAFASDTVNQTISATFASSTSSGGLFVSFQPQQTVYGRNGGMYDFADSSNFGLDVNNTVTGAATYTHTDAAVQGVSATPWTTGSLSIGAADSDRNIVVTIASNGNASNITKVEIDSGSGYVDMTVVKQYDSANPNGGGSCFALLVTAGTTATFRITGAGAKSIDVYRCIGMDISKFWFGTNSSDPMTTTVYCPAGGVVFGIAAAYAASLASVVWTGLVADTDHGPMTSGEDSGFSASSAFATVQDKLTVTCDPNVAVSERTLLVVAFGPTGVGNDFETSGFVSTDQVADTPTDDVTLGIGNYNTIDPNIPTSFTLSEANTKLVSVGAAYKAIGGTIAIEDTMRVYWEMTIDAIGDGGDTISGIVQLPYADWANGRLGGGGGNAGSQAWAVTNGTTTAYKIHLNSVSAIAGTSALSNTNILMFAYDGPAGKLYAGVNGTFYSSADIGAGTGFIYDGITGPVLPAFGTYSASVGATFNFGAKGFTYTPPTGFVALATQNLPAATIDVPSDYMNTVLYTGEQLLVRVMRLQVLVSNLTFVWIKNRDGLPSRRL